MKLLRAGLVAIALTLTAQQALATSMLFVTAEEQASMSTAIVEATVGGKDTVVFTDGRVYTDTQLTIGRVINGDAPPVLNIRQMGGSHEGVKSIIPGDARLEPGDRVVAMIRKVGQHWYLTAMGLSVWHVMGDGADAPVIRDLDGLALHDDTLQGTKASSTTPLEFTTLSSMVQALSDVPMGGEQ